MKNFSNKKVQELKKVINKQKFKKIFILSGTNSFYSSGAKELLIKVIGDKKYFLFFKKSKVPEINELKKIILSINNYNPDLIIAIGGGAVLDYGKIANNLSKVSNIEKIIITGKKIDKKFRPLLAIPTTAGSGAEVTSNAVIYIKNIKYSVEGSSLLPDYYILIPELVIGLKKDIKSAAGFDAISQSIESLLSKRSNKKSVYFAEKSLKLSIPNFISHIKKPNSHNTEKMCLAANLSGKAISISKTTAPHALSYPFTAHFGIKHGHAVSLTLNEFLKFNLENITYSSCNFDLLQRYKLLFRLTKTKNINELDAFIKKIKYDAGLENNFNKLGINLKSSFQKILKGVNPRRLSNNPVEVSISDIKTILKL